MSEPSVPRGEGASRSDGLLRLYAAVLLSHAVIQLVRPATSYRALEIGADGRAIGVITAAFALLPVFIAVSLGRVTDRAPASWLLLPGMLMMALAAVCIGLSGQIWQLVLWTSVLGLGHLAAMIGAQTLVANTASNPDRGFGHFTVATSIGQLLGPALGGVLAGNSAAPDVTPALLVAGGIGVVAALVLVNLAPAGRVPHHGVRAPGHVPLFSLLRTPAVTPSILASLAALSAVDLVTSFLPVVGQQYGIGAATVGWLLAIRGGFSIISRLSMLRLISWLGRRRLLIVSLLLSAGSLSAFTTGHQVFVLAVAMAVSGFFLGVSQPLTMSWIVQLVQPRVRGTALALRLTGNRAGQVVIPAVAGAMSGVAGVMSVFWLLSGLLASAAGAVALSSGTGDVRADTEAELE